MKKALLFLFIGILCYMQTTINANAEIKKDAGFITLNATKTQEVEPNIARISFAVENTSNNAQKAAEANNEVSNKIIEALKQITQTGIDTIKTNNFSVRPIYASSQSGKTEIKNYMAVNSITVETKDIKKVASFIDTAIGNGANRTDGLSYSFENEKKYCNSLYPEIIKDLREQANTLAQAAGTTIDGVKQINASCSVNSFLSNGRYYLKAQLANSSMAEDSASGAVVEPGKVKIQVYVNADFYVK